MRRATTITRALRAAVGGSAVLAMVLASAPVSAGPPAAKPGSAPAPGRPAARPGAPPAGAPEMSGDEANLLPYNTCKKQPRGTRFTITLPRETELEDLVNWMMSVSCQKFIWDRKVRSGKVTILSPEPVTLDEAYAAFYAALQTMGLTVEPSGKYFKIVETAEAKSRTLPVYGPSGRAPNNDRYVTQLFRARAADPKQVADLLTKLKTKQGSVETVGDLVIITDTGASVQRLMRIVRQLDSAELAGEKIFFHQLKYADAEEVADIIREVFGEKKGAKGKKTTGKGKQAAPSFSRVIVDERSGTLLIVAQDADNKVIERLIERLDVPMAMGGGRIHVVKLKNADPQEVATVLSQLASGAKATAKGKGKKAPASPVAADLFSGEVKVTPDPATRSLVILSSYRDFQSLKQVIADLDVERQQVYIEVYLLELNISKGFEAGAGAHFGRNFDTEGGQGLGFVATAPSPATSSLLLSPDALDGIVGGVFGPEIPGSGQFLGLGRDVPAFGVIIQAVQNSADVNLVAEPHLYTADNQEATIEVGRNVPTPSALTFPGGAGGTGGLVPVQSIQREDVTLRVKITPHINDEDTVTLDVEMDNRDIESIDERLGVTTTKRRLQLDKVVAHDDQPVVLGGLVQEVERETVRQVPGLGSIPVLGWLFKRKIKDRAKINLLMVLVPHIVKTPDDIRRIHERRTRERLEFLERETAFKKRDLPTNINYRRKAGLLAAVDREARRMEQEEQFLRNAEAELLSEDISGEIGMSPRVADDEPDDTSSSSKKKPKKGQLNLQPSSTPPPLPPPAAPPPK